MLFKELFIPNCIEYSTQTTPTFLNFPQCAQSHSTQAFLQHAPPITLRHDRTVGRHTCTRTGLGQDGDQQQLTQACMLGGAVISPWVCTILADSVACQGGGSLFIFSHVFSLSLLFARRFLRRVLHTHGGTRTWIIERGRTSQNHPSHSTTPSPRPHHYIPISNHSSLPAPMPS